MSLSQTRKSWYTVGSSRTIYEVAKSHLDMETKALGRI